jgi:serine/threonine protein kinase
MATGFINTHIGRYEVRERIGSGGMARVFKAWDTNLDRPVAIKILHEHLADDATFKERFKREAKFIAGFSHPNIVPIYDFDSFQHDGQELFYMVMPYISGSTLKAVLDEQLTKRQRLSHDRVLAIMLNLTDALGYAHARGMVHRDVKPGNILFNEHDHAVLTDFGIARLVEGSNLTQDGVTAGTPAYMSPEQATGQPVDKRTDLYALGIILYELLAGFPPFADESSVSILLKHVNTPVPSITRYLGISNPEMEALVTKALAKSPTERFQTAQEFAQALKPVFGVPDSVSPTLPPPPAIHDPTTAPMPPITAPELPAAQPTGPAGPVPTHRSPLGILAIGMTIIALLATIGLLSRQAAGQPASSEEGVESMTGETSLYFTSTFDSSDAQLIHWPQRGNDLLTRELTPDSYFRFRNISPQEAVTTIFEPSYTYTNAVITMEALLEEDSQVASAFGIVFRYVDEDNYNVFAVDGAGRYSIWIRERGRWRELRGERWTRHEAIRRVGELNRLTLEAVGDHFVGSVNGQVVADVNDATIASGHIGIYLATTDSGIASALIDSYSVSEASSGVPSMTEETESPES